MKFYEKLDCVMNITKTTNCALSMYLTLDSSHVSRLRRGERKLVPNAEYIGKMATYFLRQCTEEYQKRLLSEVIRKPIQLFDDPEKAVEQIHLWLLSDEESETFTVSSFMNKLNYAPPNTQGAFSSDRIVENTLETKKDISLYYGTEGKREAVIRFLSGVLERKKPGEILLYSDESMDWLTQDLAFQATWGMLMSKVIAKGNRFKIIHTVSRNLDEMLEALSKWIPLYITGSIEPYYYPKKRDGLFKQTMFIAPHSVALSSRSMQGMTDKTVNLLFKNPKAIESLNEEFNCYLSLCKPLMRIYTEREYQHFFQTLKEFESESADSMLKSDHLSLVTMPEQVVLSILNRLNIDNREEILDYYRIRKDKFFANLEKKTFREIIKIEDRERIKEGSIQVGYTGIKELSGITYRPDEYINHLKNILDLLKKQRNYSLAIDPSTKLNNYRLYAKEDLGVIVEKITDPYCAFAINETNMTAAFWDYLSNEFQERKPNKESVIKELQILIENF